MKPERVVDNLNRGMHGLFEADPSVFLIGEDILDPYGGAFRVAKGLSTKYADRVLTTPLSESSLVGIAAGLSLRGQRPIVEIMFGDFATLAFDQILNFASKSVTMYGHRLALNLMVRCPVGGNRSYGATHSQSLQKHFIGIPHLSLYELSPFHDNVELLPKLLNLGEPCMLFEDKILYTKSMFTEGVVDDQFAFDFVDRDHQFARVYSKLVPECDCVVIAPGGLSHRVIAAAKKLFLDFELGVQIIVPARLYPFDPEPLVDILTGAGKIFVVEEGVSGGTWGAEVAKRIYDRCWNKLESKIELLSSRDSIIPAAAHLEKEVLVQTEDIYNLIKREAIDAADTGT